MTSKIVDISSKRPPVRYTMHVDHYHDGSIITIFEGFGPEPDLETKKALLFALEGAVQSVKYSIEHDGEEPT